MAKQQASEEKTETSNGMTAAAAPLSENPRAPAGFRRRSAVTDAPWVENEKGNICQGRLLNRYEMNNSSPARFYYQIELTSPCKVRVGRGDEAMVEVAQAGEVVNLNESYKSKCLKEIEIPAINAGAAYDVWVAIGDKIKISGGKTMWQQDVQTKQLKAPTSQVIPLRDSDNGEEDAPF